MATFLGIDIGKRSVRGALLRTSMRSFEIERYVEIPVSALTGAPQGRVYGPALRELLSLLPSAPDSVFAAVDGMRGSLRIVGIPAAARKRAAEVLPFELESLLPFPPDEAVLDFQELGEEAGELKLMAAAVPEAAVAETLELLNEGGIAPRELSLGGLSLEGLLNFLVLPRDEAFLLAHIDSEQSDLCVVRNGRVELGRTFDEGNDSIRAGTRAVHNALHQSVMKYRAEGGPLVQKLILMGEAALDPHVVRSLGEALHIPAEPLSLPPSKGSPGPISPAFGKALGLAARPLRRNKRIDLRKGKFAAQGGAQHLRAYALLAAASSLTLVASYTFSIWAEYRVLAAERDALSAQLETITEQRFGEKTGSVTQARALLEGGARAKDPLPRFDAFRVLGVISSAFAQGVTHDTRKLEIQLDEGGQTGKFELQGQIPDLAARDAVAEALEAHECIEALERGKTSTVPGQDRKTYLLEGVIACPGGAKKGKGAAKTRTK
jgi:general secretion pathway protein L